MIAEKGEMGEEERRERGNKIVNTGCISNEFRMKNLCLERNERGIEEEEEEEEEGEEKEDE